MNADSSEPRLQPACRLAAQLWELFKTAGWAPFAVLVVHRVVLVSGLRDYRISDWLLHFSGGLTIAFFLFHVAICLEPVLGKLSRMAQLALTYTAAVTVAAVWELAEFAYSFTRGTVIQLSISETMIDLFNGMLGAAVTVAALVLCGSDQGREGSRRCP